MSSLPRQTGPIPRSGTRATRPALRLVGDETKPAPQAKAGGGRGDTPHAREAARRRAVARENESAANLPAHDARRLVAVRVAQRLEGGKAGILRPDARRELVAQAQQLGLRPFDANLVIAIMQDAARNGELAQTLSQTQTAQQMDDQIIAAANQHLPRRRVNRAAQGAATLTPATSVSLPADAESRVSMVRQAGSRGPSSTAAAAVAIACSLMLAAGLAIAAIRWFTAG